MYDRAGLGFSDRPTYQVNLSHLKTALAFKEWGIKKVKLVVEISHCTCVA